MAGDALTFDKFEDLKDELQAVKQLTTKDLFKILMDELVQAAQKGNDVTEAARDLPQKDLKAQPKPEARPEEQQLQQPGQAIQPKPKPKQEPEPKPQQDKEDQAQQDQAQQQVQQQNPEEDEQAKNIKQTQDDRTGASSTPGKYVVRTGSGGAAGNTLGTGTINVNAMPEQLGKGSTIESTSDKLDEKKEDAQEAVEEHDEKQKKAVKEDVQGDLEETAEHKEKQREGPASTPTLTPRG